MGVVADHKVERLDESPTPMLYFPAGRNPLQAGFVLARTDADATTLLAPMRAELARVSPALPVSGLATLESRLGDTLVTARITAGLLAAFAALALLLAGLGVYALGADRARVVRAVVLRASAAVVLGLVVGLVVAGLGAPLLERLLFGVPALDPVTFGGAAGVLTLLGAVAAWIPARRAASADPVRSLRTS